MGQKPRESRITKKRSQPRSVAQEEIESDNNSDNDSDNNMNDGDGDNDDKDSSDPDSALDSEEENEPEIEGDAESEEEEDEEEEEDQDDDGDVDKAILKAVEERKKKASGSSTNKQRRQYLNSLMSISTMEELSKEMRKSFQEAQTTAAVHKRQLTILKTLMERAIKLNLTKGFNRMFCKLLLKILPLKKSIIAGDKVVKFISSFFDISNPANIDVENKTANEIEVYGYVYSRFVEYVFKFLLDGLDAIDTNVRYRTCQLFAATIGNCGGLDENLYKRLVDELKTRVYDRDASVRCKAVAALACFQNEDDSHLSLAGKTLRNIMQNDLKADVRRTCLKNIEKNRFTEPYIVERARDVDPSIRKLLFAKILPTCKKFTDIRSTNRQKLLEWGLRDRDENVRKAAANWVTTTWMNDVDNDLKEFLDLLNVTRNDIADTALRALIDKSPQIIDELKNEKDLFENLTPSFVLFIRVTFEYCQDNNRSDLIESIFVESSEFASIIEKYFTLRTENFMKISDHREELQKNPEFANTLDIIDPDEYNYIIMQLLRIAVDYDYSDEYGRSKMNSLLRSILSSNTITEPILPLLMECLRKLAINERDFCQMIVEIINDLKDSEYERVMELKRKEEAERAEVEELNKRKNKKRSRRNGTYEEIDDSSDQEDEIAKISENVRNLLKDNGDISDEDSDEEDYHSAMNDLSRQSIMDANKSRQEEIDQIGVLSPEILIDCLTITKCMLQLVFAPLRENMLLISILENFIVPCINQRSEVEIRQLALICHALCGLLDKEVAISTMSAATIFIAMSAYESFIVAGLKVMGDLLAIHGLSIVQSNNDNSIDTMTVAKIFYRTLKDYSKPEAQSLVAVILFKLFLGGVITDSELFETTLLTYLNPKVNNNPPLKQALEFCIPAYAFSHKSHQELIASIVHDTIERLFKDWEGITTLNHGHKSKDQVTSTKIVERLVEWTDPTNLAEEAGELWETSESHLIVGIQFMKLLRYFDYHNKLHKELYKPILKALKRLVFSKNSPIDKLREFSECFDDELLCNGEISEVLNSDGNCRSSFQFCHSKINQCLTEAELIERERVKTNEELNINNVNKIEEDSKNEDIGTKEDDLEDVSVQDAEGDEPDIEAQSSTIHSGKPEDPNEDESDDSINIIQEITLKKTVRKVKNEKKEDVIKVKEEHTNSDVSVKTEPIDTDGDLDNIKSKSSKHRKERDGRVKKLKHKKKPEKKKTKKRTPSPVGDTSEVILLDSE